MCECRLCKSLNFYLDLLKVTLRHNRYDSGLVRTAMDNIAAILNGYTSNSHKNTFFSGNWSKFKTSCFATHQALKLLSSSQNPHQEHVIPINVIWNKKIKAVATDDLSLLVTIYKYVIPCLITENQRLALDTKYKKNMAIKDGDLDDPNVIWSRYALTEIELDNGTKNRLIDQVTFQLPKIKPSTDIGCTSDVHCLMKRFNESKREANWDRNQTLLIAQNNADHSDKGQ